LHLYHTIAKNPIDNFESATESLGHVVELIQTNGNIYADICSRVADNYFINILFV